MCHIWWKRGERPPGLLDQRYVNAYIYAAIEPGTDNAFALILPDANREGMQAFLDAFAETIGKNEHVALVLDGAGWHSSKTLRVPASITLVPLPPYSPELNPVERVWALFEGALPLDEASQRLQGDRHCRVAGLEAPVSSDWTPDLAHVIPVDHEN